MIMLTVIIIQGYHCYQLHTKFYNILIEFGIPLKLVRIIKMCLNDNHSKVHVGKNLMHFLFRMI